MEDNNLLMIAIATEYFEECISAGRIIMGHEAPLPRGLGQYSRSETERAITNSLSLLITGFEMTAKIRRGHIVITAIPS